MKPWINFPEDISDYIGFIYEITNLVNGRKYIGMKLFWHKRTKKLTRKPTKAETQRLAKYEGTPKYKPYKAQLKKKYKGKKKTIHSIVESDWEFYQGSSNMLLEDIKELGDKRFSRRILACYKSKFECSYYEAKEQFDRDVLFRDDYYNRIINVRLNHKA